MARSSSTGRDGGLVAQSLGWRAVTFEHGFLGRLDRCFLDAWHKFGRRARLIES